MDNYIHQRVEIDLSIDERTGEPFIKIRRHDKSQDINQKLLKLFVHGALERGLKIECVGGIASTDGDSWDDYVVSVNPKQ
jgi:hypothetical protein